MLTRTEYEDPNVNNNKKKVLKTVFDQNFKLKEFLAIYCILATSVVPINLHLK